MSARLDALLKLSPEERREIVYSLEPSEALTLLYDWEGMWARPQQVEPITDPQWLFWFLCGGRGSGKTRPAAEWVVKRSIRDMPGSRGFVAARTLDDVRLTCVEGDSGILSCLPPDIEKQWNRTTCELVIRAGDNGTRIKGFTSEKPAQGRGPQHHWGWGDEFAAWLKEGALWDQLMFGLRLPWGERAAQAVITSTPLPIESIRKLFRRAGKLVTTPDGRTYIDVVLTKMTTYENLANLSANYVALVQQYEGTRLGRQELLAELLDDTPGALWQRHWFERPGFRIDVDPADCDFICVGVDPAITSKSRDQGDEDDSDDTGIVAVGRLKPGLWIDARGRADSTRDHFVVLADWTRGCPPAEWARNVVDLYRMVQADLVIGEKNRGGDLVEAVIRQEWADVPYLGVNASRGKRTRAEPIATIYEQGRAHHIRTPFSQMGVDGLQFDSLIHLEDQFCTWVPGLGDSPDRLDAGVWAMTAATTEARIFVR